MIRVVIENLLLFLAPALIYFGYALLTSRQSEQQGSGSGGSTTANVLENAPYGWLFIAGAAVVVATVFAFGSNSGGIPGQHYTPPTMKDGRIQPGHIE